MGTYYPDNLDKVARLIRHDAQTSSFTFNCAASEAKAEYYGQRKKKISREQCNTAMQDFLNQGGKITKLPNHGYGG